MLLACDVIAVCKKLHNEEVRKERLAALKSTRTVRTGSLHCRFGLVPTPSEHKLAHNCPKTLRRTQDQLSTRLAAPTRRSPEVKVRAGGG